MCLFVVCVCVFALRVAVGSLSLAAKQLCLASLYLSVYVDRNSISSKQQEQESTMGFFMVRCAAVCVDGFHMFHMQEGAKGVSEE